jgi:hypothetical protein
VEHKRCAACTPFHLEVVGDRKYLLRDRSDLQTSDPVDPVICFDDPLGTDHPKRRMVVVRSSTDFGTLIRGSRSHPQPRPRQRTSCTLPGLSTTIYATLPPRPSNSPNRLVTWPNGWMKCLELGSGGRNWERCRNARSLSITISSCSSHPWKTQTLHPAHYTLN